MENGETIENTADSEDGDKAEDAENESGHGKKDSKDDGGSDKDMDKDEDDKSDEEDGSTVPSAPPAEDLQELWENESWSLHFYNQIL